MRYLTKKMIHRLQYLKSPLLVVGIIVLLIFGDRAIVAQDSEGARGRIEQIDKEIHAERDRLEKSRLIERSIFSEFQSLDNLVNLEKRKDNELRSRIAEVESLMEGNVREEARLGEVIRDERRKLGRRFRAMYIDGPSSFVELALNAESFSDLSRREVFFRALAKADAGLIEEYRGNLKVLRDVQKRLEIDRSHLMALQRDVENTRRELEKERAGKADLLRAAREDKDTHLRVITELEAAGRRVGGVIARNERKEEEERKAEEARRQAAIQAARLATPESRQHGEESRQVGTVPPLASQAAPPVVSQAALPPNRMAPPRQPIPQAPSIPAPEPAFGGFGEQRGRMCAPSVGPVVQSFGIQRNPRFGTQTYSKGIAIAAPEGAPVRAVWDGEVVYAGWFSGYGKILIVNHGDHYYTLYAHASTLLKSAGQTVKRGEVIARVGDTGSLEGPQVYFEVRHESNAMNPLGWVRVGC